MNERRDTAMVRLSRFRKGLVTRLACRLAIAGVLCLLLAPVLHLVAAAEEGGAELVVLCTDHGMEQFVLDSEGKPVPLHKAGHHICACCLIAPDQGDQAMLGVSVAPPEGPVRVAAIRAVVPAAVFPERHFLSGRESRAPPASA